MSGGTTARLDIASLGTLVQRLFSVGLAPATCWNYCRFQVGRMIKEQGFTRKKVELRALQRSEEKRIEFMAEISLFNPDMLIWIDKTGSDR